MISLTIVGVLVPYTDPGLIGSSSSDANASPFVIAVRNAGISVVPSIMNVVILIAVLSVGNSSIYGSSRTIAALADRGQAPKWLGYIDRSGRPLAAILFSSLFGFVAYIVAAGDDARGKAFTWMLAISGLAAIFNWASICLCHIRFRQAFRAQGHTLDELAFKSQATVYGSWVGFIFNLLILVAQFWTGFAPVGYGEMTAGERVENFFEAYLAAPIVILCYVIYKLVYKTRFKRLSEIDVTSGKRELNLAALLAEERAEQALWPRWKKIYKTVC
jgi:amino acid transporter